MLNLLEKFSDVTVLVIGDVMLDQYWWGSVERISPEAPVPVVQVNKKSIVPGGAANVAVNIAALGAKPILISVVGNDKEGESFAGILKNSGVSETILIKLDRPTTVKTRIIANNQQIVRIDQEESVDLFALDEERVWSEIENQIDNADIVLISDYAKGVITKNISERLISNATKMNKYVIVDPKGKNYEKYRSATLLTPNNKEAFEATKSEFTGEKSVELVGCKLLKELSLDSLLITRGEMGMTLFQKDLNTKTLNASARKVYDVTGAGDTVIATLTTAIGAGIDFYNAAKLANTAAGIVVEKVGTTAIDLKRLKSKLAEK